MMQEMVNREDQETKERQGDTAAMDHHDDDASTVPPAPVHVPSTPLATTLFAQSLHVDTPSDAVAATAITIATAPVVVAAAVQNDGCIDDDEGKATDHVDGREN